MLDGSRFLLLDSFWHKRWEKQAPFARGGAGRAIRRQMVRKFVALALAGARCAFVPRILDGVHAVHEQS
jgi:hypothetical protein